MQRTGPTGWAPPKHTLLTTVIVLVGALAGVLSVLAAIFDGGLTSAQRDEAAALRDQAAFNYRSTVLAALNEVEDSLIALQRLEEQAEHVEAQRNALAETFRHATNRYRAGYSPHLDQLDAQRGLLSAELSLVQIQADGSPRVWTYIARWAAVGRPRIDNSPGNLLADVSIERISTGRCCHDQSCLARDQRRRACTAILRSPLRLDRFPFAQER